MASRIKAERSLTKALIVCALISSWHASQIPAAQLHLSLDYITTLSDDGVTNLGRLLTRAPHTVLPNYVNQFEISFAITGAAANEDFNGMQFDVVMSPGFSPVSSEVLAGYIPDTPLYNPPGPAPLAGIYSLNADSGANTNDLKRIIVLGSTASSGAAPFAYMHGFRPGIVGTGRIGDIFVHWNKATERLCRKPGC